MSIMVRCGACETAFKVSDGCAGKKGRCTRCGAVVEVPGAKEAPPPGRKEDDPSESGWEPEAMPSPITPESEGGGGAPGGDRMDENKSSPAPVEDPGSPATGSASEEESRSPEKATPVAVLDGEAQEDASAPPPSEEDGDPTACPVSDHDPPLCDEVLPVERRESAPLAVKRQLSAIHSLVERGQFLEAMQALKGIDRSAGGHPGHRYLQGLAYAGLGNYPHALDNLRLAIEGGVRTPAAYAAKGKAELELGRHVEAIESMDTALDAAGTDIPDYMADLAKAYDGASMRQDAVATWNALAKISPNHPALVERKRIKEEQQTRKHAQDVQSAMLQMQKEQRASDTACWICIVLRILLECM
jgi:hypothetical protein